MDDNLAQDLVVMWQSEFAAMAADREVRENWAAMMALWSQSALSALALAPHEHARGGAGPAQPPGAAPAITASQPSLGEIEQLERRVVELEQRLAGFDAARPGPSSASGGL